MMRWAAIRRHLATFGRIVAGLDATGTAAAASSGLATIEIQAPGAAAAPQLGAALLLGEDSVFPAGAGTDAVATISVDATGRGSSQSDAGFPYTFPIVFGGTPAIEGEAIGTVILTLDATAAAAANADAIADIAVTAFAATTSSGLSGFPYHFPIRLG